MVLPPVAALPLPQPAVAGSSAQVAATAQTATGQATTTTAQAPGVATLQSALAAVRQSAAVTQDGLAVLMANVLRATTAANLPPAVQAAMQQLLSLHLSTSKAPDAAAVKNAMLSSGLFTEAMLAAGGLPADLKTALARLAEAAGRWLAKTGNPPPPQSGGPSVPPPVPGGPPVAQGPALPALPEDADAALIAKLLAGGAEAALARQSLLQMASLPDTTAETRWVFDVPLMTPQGAAVAGLIVTRDGKGATADAPEPVWRIGLAIDIEPLGPVRANLALSGGHAWVTIGADRPDSLAKLADNAAWLSEALIAAELESDIAFQTATGTSKGSRTPLVDRAS